MTPFSERLQALFSDKKEPSEGPHSFAKNHNEASLGLFARLRKQPGNLFFSPFSIRTALAMAFVGARGKTAAQMRKALRFPQSDEALHGTFGQMIERLNAVGGGRYEMNVANSLWGQEGQAVEPDFLELTSRYYGGGLEQVDFVRDSETARKAINEWVEEKTKRKISKIIPEGGLDPATRLVLVNAVYFKGKWERVFDKAATSEQPFYLENGRTVQAPLMFQNGFFRHLHTGGLQLVELDYRGEDLSMLVLLPDKGNSLRRLESKLSARLIKNYWERMYTCSVDLSLPRFKMTWGAEQLTPHLSELGMPLAFEHRRADFSGINGLEPPHPESLFLSSVVHKAFVEVNEEGTEAAAATEVMMIMGRPEQRSFRADRPFLFAILNRRTGAFLFLGRVADPTQEN